MEKMRAGERTKISLDEREKAWIIGAEDRCAPIIRVRREPRAMGRLPYQFDMLDEVGERNCLFIAQCFGDEHAIILARALFDSTFVQMKRILVWRDDVLIHEAAKTAAYN